jgi:hypothetical protein
LPLIGLKADRLAAVEDDEVEDQSSGFQLAGTRQKWRITDRGPLGGRRVGPRKKERHERRVVDTLGGNVGERGQLFVRRPAQFKIGRVSRSPTNGQWSISTT